MKYSSPTFRDRAPTSLWFAPRISSATSRPRASRSPDLRALLVRAGALGDLLLLRRTIHALRRAGHSVSLVAPAGPAAALVGPGPAEVDHVIPWEGARVAGLLSSDGEARSPAELTGFDVAVTYTRNKALVRSLAAAIPRVLSHDPSPPVGERVHASAWLSRPLEVLGVTAAEEPPDHAASEAESRATEQLRERLGLGFLAIHPGSGSARKNWPAQRFGQIAAAIADGRPWLLVEGPADEASARVLERVIGAVPTRHLPLRVLGALLAHAGAYVGNDSGVSHLAAAWGAPTVVLFGPTDPDVWSHVGTRVRVVRAPDDTLESLHVPQVEDAVRAVLSCVRSEAGGRPLG